MNNRCKTFWDLYNEYLEKTFNTYRIAIILIFIIAFQRLKWLVQGTTLTGTDKDLLRLFTAHSEHAKKVEMALEQTAWKFNPSAMSLNLQSGR